MRGKLIEKKIEREDQIIDYVNSVKSKIRKQLSTEKKASGSKPRVTLDHRSFDGEIDGF